jgi:hypothetical protein
MRIEILRSVMVSGEPVQAGSLIEVSLSDANLLIGMGKACFAPAEPVPQPEPDAPKRTRKSTTTIASEED